MSKWGAPPANDGSWSGYFSPVVLINSDMTGREGTGVTTYLLSPITQGYSLHNTHTEYPNQRAISCNLSAYRLLHHARYSRKKVRGVCKHYCTFTNTMSEVQRKFSSLASLCQHVIAKNLERYPPECFCSLAENEWDSIVRLKYKMTDPKIKTVNGGLLSGGRSKPMINDKDINSIESKNPLLAKSKLADSLVWKDCVNFRFKTEGSSRPRIMRCPWGVQVSKMQQIANDLPLFWKEPKGEGLDNVEAINVARTKKLRSHIQVLITSPMSIPLLSESTIGKAVKKFIKECKRHGSKLPAWVPEVNGIHDTPNPAYRGKSLLAQMEILLSSWKTLASASGASTCHGRHRNTSEEQHMQDLETVQQCMDWRKLFAALSQREQLIIKSRGAKMRRIREDLESDRHKVQSTKTKQMGNRKLGSRLLYGDAPELSGGQGAGTGAGGLSKLGKLRKASNAQNARVVGKSLPKTSTFGCSVASSTY